MVERSVSPELTWVEENGPAIEMHPLMSRSDPDKHASQEPQLVQHDTSYKQLSLVLASLWIGGLFVALGQSVSAPLLRRIKVLILFYRRDYDCNHIRDRGIGPRRFR